MHVEQFVMAYGVEQDRLRAILPEGFSSLRPVLRINAEIRDGKTVYPKEPFTARNAANIPCTQVLGTYMVKGVYMAADHTDINPNNTKLSAYTAYVGNTVNECEEYVWRRMETFRRTCGEPTGPMMRSTFRTLHEADKQRMAAEFLQKMHWDQRLPQIDFDDPG